MNRTGKINKLLKSHMLDAKHRTAIGKAIHKLGNYHDGIPVSELFDILEAQGLVALDEDNTRLSAIFCGRKGVARIPVGYAHTEHLVNTIPSYEPVENSLLILNWEKLSTKMEIVAYMS